MAFDKNLTARIRKALARKKGVEEWKAFGGPYFMLNGHMLDRFKLVNDSLGHHQGDELLAQVGRRLTAIAGQGQTVARPGGDEFAVLVDDVAGPVEARALAERLLVDLTKPIAVGDRQLVVTGSVGVALYEPIYDRADDMMRDAELAMYRAKSLGKARAELDRKSTRLNSSHVSESRMPSSA